MQNEHMNSLSSRDKVTWSLMRVIDLVGISPAGLHDNSLMLAVYSSVQLSELSDASFTDTVPYFDNRDYC